MRLSTIIAMSGLAVVTAAMLSLVGCPPPSNPDSGSNTPSDTHTHRPEPEETVENTVPPKDEYDMTDAERLISAYLKGRADTNRARSYEWDFEDDPDSSEVVTLQITSGTYATTWNTAKFEAFLAKLHQDNPYASSSADSANMFRTISLEQFFDAVMLVATSKVSGDADLDDPSRTVEIKITQDDEDIRIVVNMDGAEHNLDYGFVIDHAKFASITLMSAWTAYPDRVFDYEGTTLPEKISYAFGQGMEQAIIQNAEEKDDLITVTDVLKNQLSIRADKTVTMFAGYHPETHLIIGDAHLYCLMDEQSVNRTLTTFAKKFGLGDLNVDQMSDEDKLDLAARCGQLMAERIMARIEPGQPFFTVTHFDQAGELHVSVSPYSNVYEQFDLFDGQADDNSPSGNAPRPGEGDGR